MCNKKTEEDDAVFYSKRFPRNCTITFSLRRWVLVGNWCQAHFSHSSKKRPSFFKEQEKSCFLFFSKLAFFSRNTFFLWWFRKLYRNTDDDDGSVQAKTFSGSCSTREGWALLSRRICVLKSPSRILGTLFGTTYFSVLTSSSSLLFLELQVRWMSKL